MIRFSRYMIVYALISALAIVPGLVFLFLYGLKPSIDFSGGTLVELRVAKTITSDRLKQESAAHNIVFSGIQRTGTGTYILRSKPVADKDLNGFMAGLNKEATGTATIIREETVGPILGEELLRKAVIAATLAVTAILLYVAYAFRNMRYGVAAIIALVHDLVVVVGSFAIFGHFLGVEVDTLFVTAILTTMSFSVHDTIVVFDRIREYQKRNSALTFEEISDRALTETMGRSIANSVTIILMLFALVLLGGENVKWFAMALLIGTVSGTYSSPFVATPALLLITRFSERRK